MESILENLIVEEERDGSFTFTINQDTEVVMSSYDMAKFTYLLRSYLQNTNIDKNVTRVIRLQSTYELDGEYYYADTWLTRDDDDESITINVHYTKKDGAYLSKGYLDRQDIEPDVTTIISFQKAQELISDYIELEYQKMLADD